MPLLTPGEYDDLPQEAKDALAGVVRHPRRDVKDRSYVKKHGRLMNGQVDADPDSLATIGYGTGLPTAPGSPVESIDPDYSSRVGP